MIRKLRIKFVCIVMTIAALMVGGILGVFIHFTLTGMEMQSMNMMVGISSAPFHKGFPGKPEQNEVRLPFFTVRIGKDGEPIATGGDYFDLSDRESLQEIVDLALESDEKSGELKEHNLRFLVNKTPNGVSIVFSDTTTEEATRKNLLYNSSLIFCAAMVVFLGIGILLSRWVIKPVEKAWDQQRQFVADASHELKTPLSVIMANAELVDNDDLSREEQKKFSQNILSTTYQMRSLVENMLEMARVDNGTENLHFSNVDFSQLVEDVVLSFQLLYEEKGIGLECAVSDTVSLRGSEQHLYQVMDVLLDNGLKYSAKGTTVSVELSQTGRHCLLAVRSTGEPIPQEELKNIFKRFYRTDKARSMNGSYGLGLSIAQSIVQSHKGKIWAESDEHRNSFFVRLPIN